MKIVQITPGSGDNFYCENCLRDIALVKALQGLGHEVVMVPLYFPVQLEKGGGGAKAPIFFSGINVFLEQKLAIFRRTPRWIDRLFASPGLLRWVSRFALMTSARALGETMISMLQGERGRQAKELDRLVKWLGGERNRPDVVCLSNVLLCGLARRIRDELGLPVVSMLEDEDGFLDTLAEPYKTQAWQIISQRAGDIDRFICISGYFAGVMQQRLGIDSDKIDVVYSGVAAGDYQPAEGSPAAPTIGFLSRLCEDKGLDTLIDVFIALKAKAGFEDLRLRAAGGMAAGDRRFINRLMRKLTTAGVAGEVEFLRDFEGLSRAAFLKTLSVLSVPEKRPVSAGMYVFEAWASGVPVVQPASGIFPEILESGGGLLYEPGDVDALTAALEKVLADSDYAAGLARRGRQAVLEKFGIEQTARQIERTYDKLITNGNGQRDA